ncbi:MAG TPA: helix-turn-helix transcriptional regulator [Syntrophorhabdales bacterium]|nr:helix-turn-helix transcriptional regulator [Syntrophorhabdales bacterium]
MQESEGDKSEPTRARPQGPQIRLLRTLAGMSQETLAHAVGVGQNMISMVEGDPVGKGIRNLPKPPSARLKDRTLKLAPQKIRHLARLFGVREQFISEGTYPAFSERVILFDHEVIAKLEKKGTTVTTQDKNRIESNIQSLFPRFLNESHVEECIEAKGAKACMFPMGNSLLIIQSPTMHIFLSVLRESEWSSFRIVPVTLPKDLRGGHLAKAFIERCKPRLTISEDVSLLLSEYRSWSTRFMNALKSGLRQERIKNIIALLEKVDIRPGGVEVFMKGKK